VARKQSDYLAGLLGGDTPEGAADETPIETKSMPRGGGGATTLLNRESALARVASGEVRQVTQLLLDPARVRIWPGNARVYADLTETGCRELIDSILAEGGQKVPAVVRRVVGDADHEYEVIAGTRRHFAISWLRANNYPEMRFLAQVADLDDEAAFRLADLENRARKDVTDLERARNYAEALRLHYGGHQTRMAERLKLSKGWLSKMLKVASLPDWVVRAYGSPAEIALATAYPIAQAIEDESIRGAISEEASTLEIEQRRHRRKGEPTIPSPEVTRRLLAAPKAGEGADRASLYSWSSKIGRPGLSVMSANRQGVTVRLHAGSGATPAELADALRAALRDLEKQGLGLKR
jgi:ParB family transcriptional regulator, chromosome partitioning protein